MHPERKARKETPQHPNVIHIYADDLGRGMLSCYGQKQFQTPNIDRIAADGARFDSAYGCVLCAPARASLLVGRHDCHAGAWTFTNGNVYTMIDSGEMAYEEVREVINNTGIQAGPDDVFLAQLFKQAGYITGQVGKLEWGFATTPERMARHGWDYHYGYYDHVRCHGFYPPYLFENGEHIDNVTERFTSESCGDIFDGNDGMSGLKRTSWEGGARVPWLVSWPGRTRPGSVSTHTMAAYDLFATVADMLDIDPPPEKDGISFLPTISGRADGQAKHDHVACAGIYHGASLVTDDGWKLRRVDHLDLMQLYFLPDDYQEMNDLAAERPDKLRELSDLMLAACDGDYTNGNVGSQRVGYDHEALNRHLAAMKERRRNAGGRRQTRKQAALGSNAEGRNHGGMNAYSYRREQYAEPSEFGYKDFIPLFQAERFDAAEWAALFKQACAHYVVPVAEHHDGYAMYRSHHTRWNVVDTGPKRDVMGAWLGANGEAIFGTRPWTIYGEGPTQVSTGHHSEKKNKGLGSRCPTELRATTP